MVIIPDKQEQQLFQSGTAPTRWADVSSRLGGRQPIGPASRTASLIGQWSAPPKNAESAESGKLSALLTANRIASSAGPGLDNLYQQRRSFLPASFR
jgi:hypothetical protein